MLCHVLTALRRTLTSLVLDNNLLTSAGIRELCGDVSDTPLRTQTGALVSTIHAASVRYAKQYGWAPPQKSPGTDAAAGSGRSGGGGGYGSRSDRNLAIDMVGYGQGYPSSGSYAHGTTTVVNTSEGVEDNDAWTLAQAGASGGGNAAASVAALGASASGTLSRWPHGVAEEGRVQVSVARARLAVAQAAAAAYKQQEEVNAKAAAPSGAHFDSSSNRTASSSSASAGTGAGAGSSSSSSSSAAAAGRSVGQHSTVPPLPPDSLWACSLCTYHNGEWRGFCEMCGHAKPAAPAPGAAAAAAKPAPQQGASKRAASSSSSSAAAASGHAASSSAAAVAAADDDVIEIADDDGVGKADDEEAAMRVAMSIMMAAMKAKREASAAADGAAGSSTSASVPESADLVAGSAVAAAATATAVPAPPKPLQQAQQQAQGNGKKKLQQQVQARQQAVKRNKGAAAAIANRPDAKGLAHMLGRREAGGGKKLAQAVTAAGSSSSSSSAAAGAMGSSAAGAEPSGNNSNRSAAGAASKPPQQQLKASMLSALFDRQFIHAQHQHAQQAAANKGPHVVIRTSAGFKGDAEESLSSDDEEEDEDEMEAAAAAPASVSAAAALARKCHLSRKLRQVMSDFYGMGAGAGAGAGASSSSSNSSSSIAAQPRREMVVEAAPWPAAVEDDPSLTDCSTGLAACTKLTRLSLVNTCMVGLRGASSDDKDEGVGALCMVLRRLTSLTTLDVSENWADDGHAQDIAEALVDGPARHEVTSRSTRYDVSTGRPYVHTRVLQTQGPLRSLRMAGCMVTKDGAAKVRAMLPPVGCDFRY